MKKVKFYKTFCNFCGKEFDEENILLECDCEEYKRAIKKFMEEIEEEPGYRAPLDSEEYEKRYPEIYSGKKCISEKYKKYIALSVRKVDDGYNFCVFYPFVNENGEIEDTGMCLDMDFEDVPFLLEMISESFITISKKTRESRAPEESIMDNFQKKYDKN
jgi:hypothetical protein